MPTKTTSKGNARKKGAAKKAAKKSTGIIKGIRLHTATRQPIKVEYLTKPPTFVKPKKIHSRHLLPLVREGLERQFHSQSSELLLHSFAMAAPMAATDELAVVTSTELSKAAQQQTASSVGEPSVAINGNVVFFTGNWYAAVSSDMGKTFKFIDPSKSFPDPSPTSQFCCDQVVHYISKIDTFVWLLQYGPEAGDNIQRLAFAKTADVVKGKWRLFDITTKSLKVSGAFLDFPDLAVGANSLYVTTNIFGPGNQVGSAVIRIPFSGIESGQVKAQPFVSMDLQSFRVAQNCGNTAFFAAHQDTSTLAVFSWKEGQTTPVPKAVGVARWLGGNSGYVSRTPDGRRWLDRADPRLTGATLAKNELWFAWTVDRGSNHRPRPFIQIAKIDATNLTLIDNINIFDSNSATAYAGLSTNEENEVGITYMIGGGTMMPSHVVGILTGNRKDVVVAKGDRGPLDPDTGKGEWGDYLTVRRVFPNQKLFAAAGYTMKGPGDGSNRDSTPRFVVFGRASDTGVVGGGINVGGGTGVVIAPGGGGGTAGEAPVVEIAAGTPFKDVNSLPRVSNSVAAAIKAAAVAEGNKQTPIEGFPVSLKLVTKPGVERWPVKTGTDIDRALVGKNMIEGHDFGAGIVEATVEELVRIGRPPGMRPATSGFDSGFHDKRLGVVEKTVWSVEADVIALKQEKDGDYHLVIQGASGKTMIAEIPTPTKVFVGSSPWLNNMKVARAEIDKVLVSKFAPADFVQMDDMLVPRKSLPMSEQPQAMAAPASVKSFTTPEEGLEIELPTFQAKVHPTAARITGVGFFDRVHDQTGVALLNGIEIHPILKIEWL